MRVDNETWTNFKTQITTADPSFECDSKNYSGWCGSHHDCSDALSNLSDVTLAVNDTYKMSIPPAGYLFSKSSVNPDWNCVMAIRGGLGNKTEVQLGTYFLANYYTEFHYDNMTIGLGVNKFNSWNATVEPAASPSDDDSGLSTLALVMIILSCILGVIILIAAVYCCSQKSKGGASVTERDALLSKFNDEEEDEQPLHESLN